MSDKAFRNYFIRKLGGYSILKMAKFDEPTNKYESDSLCDYTQGFLDGSLRTFQDQQKQIDELQARVGDLEFYVRQFLDVLASKHEAHLKLLPELLCHLNSLVNEEALKGDMNEQHINR